MDYIQKQSPFWWTRNLNSTIYFLRELTGVAISFYTIYFLSLAFYAYMKTQPLAAFLQRLDFRIVSFLGLAAAIFHTITWLWVTVQLTPFPLKKSLQIVLFVMLIGGWIGASYFLLKFLYV